MALLFKAATALLFLATFGAVCIASSWENPGSRACYRDGIKAKGYLKTSEKSEGVIPHSGNFHANGHQYDFVAYSLWGFPEPYATKTCIRYEVENIGSEKIDSFTWEDADFYFVPIVEKHRIRHVVNAVPPYPAVRAYSKVHAFRNSKHLVWVWLPSGEIHTLESAASARFSRLFVSSTRYQASDSIH